MEAKGAGLFEIVQWLGSHLLQVQICALALTFAFLATALVLMNRVANELDRSRANREAANKSFERATALLASIEAAEMKSPRRIQLRGEQNRSRPASADATVKRSKSLTQIEYKQALMANLPTRNGPKRTVH